MRGENVGPSIAVVAPIIPSAVDSFAPAVPSLHIADLQMDEYLFDAESEGLANASFCLYFDELQQALFQA